MVSFKEILSDLSERYPLGQEGPIIGWTCTYLPLEILEAGRLQPYRIIPEPSSERADSYLDPNFCPFIRASLGKAIGGEYPFLSGIILLNTCDGMRRLYDAWRFYSPPSFLFLLDLPRVMTSSLAYFRMRLQELKEEIECHFEVKITEDRLFEAIEEANLTRSLLQRLLFLKGRGNPPLQEGDILDILTEGGRNPRKIFNEALQGLVKELEPHPPASLNGPKLLVTGSLLEGSSLIRLVEELGGEVVVSDLCTGGRFLEEVPPFSDPLEALSKAYLNKPLCARMWDTERRIANIKAEISRTGAQALIYFALKFCDPYLYEVPALKVALQEVGIPVLFIEGEYTGRVSGGVRTRVQAFLEMLERDLG
ncbi:MAG: 2-hydroxyacyl-CoA dehydratase [Deltaproteobacteria bacterium]|nr:2-hydroxyacyl-CoA dehydratase [Deltaproteobacteria bacterium]